MTPLTEVELLAVWEKGLEQTATERTLHLAACAWRADPAEVARLPLGRRDALLYDLHEACFGSALTCEVDCPACAERLELELTTTQLRVAAPAQEAADVATPEGTVTVRPVTGADLLDLSGANRRRTVVSRCVLDPPPTLSDAAVEAVAARLAALDPQADITLSLGCESCGHEWLGPFDIGAFLWAQVDTYARRLLFDVHALALAYGWSEPDVLAVSPRRRRLYLEAVPA